MSCLRSVVLLMTVNFITTLATRCVAEDEVENRPGFQQVQEILNSRCAGCHNDNDREGDFSLSSADSLRKGTPDGPVIDAAHPEKSKLLHLITGDAEPAMPPEDEPQLTSREIAVIKQWILDGGQLSSTDRLSWPKSVPNLKPAAHRYVGAAVRSGTDSIALGTMGRVELRESQSDELLWKLDGLPGKINSLRTSSDGRYIIAGGGLTGVGGEILVIGADDGAVVRRLHGHNDTVYCASMSPDGNWIASGSYDRDVLIWSAKDGTIAHRLSGHNGAIYDLDFDPQGKILATASADQTIKLWQVSSGERLDTLGQAEGEMRCVRFSSDGTRLFGAGEDRQIRLWQIISKDQPAINPMLLARYAHEAGILQLELTAQGNVVTGSADKSVKQWSGDTIVPLGAPLRLDEVPIAVLPSTGTSEKKVTIIELTGQSHSTDLAPAIAAKKPEATQSAIAKAQSPAKPPEANQDTTSSASGTIAKVAETEPNNSPSSANRVALPATIDGVVNRGSEAPDTDLYAFQCQAGEQWIFEVTASKNGSKLDSWIDVLDSQGEGIIRTRLQAVRESYFTFRGKDSATSDDFRLHKWQEMELNEYLYSSGEVTRLWLYPRGPDSGFKVYPGFGSRYTFFGTTPVSHALGEPAYVVRPLAEDQPALPNGLPVFPIYYENDDDPQRRGGKDSRLSFTAPYDGEFVLRIRDARGFDGPDLHYRLQARKPEPDFSLTFTDTDLSMPIGSGREWKVQATRLDGLTAPISITLDGVPEGFLATNPLVIEAGQDLAYGTIYAPASASLPRVANLPHDTDATSSSEAEPKEFVTVSIDLTARSNTGTKQIVRKLSQELELTLNRAKETQFRLVEAADSTRSIDELVIRPGQTISARIIAERNGSNRALSFGKEDAGRNLPHGSFVDNIGLNGLLIPEDQTQREFFITASPVVQPGRRQFHLRLEGEGKATSRPIWLNVRE